MRFYIIFILLFLNLNISCSQEYEYIEENNIIKVEQSDYTQYLDKDSLPLNGYYKFFDVPSNYGFADDKLIKVQIIDGKLNGKVNTYLKNPDFKIKNGSWTIRKHDEVIRNSEKEYSVLYKSDYYNNGILNGKSKIFKDDILNLEINFKKGLLHGFMIKYHPNGNIQYKAEFKNDSLVENKVLIYDKNGKFLSEKIYEEPFDKEKFLKAYENGTE